MTNFHLSTPLVLASTSEIREKMLNDLGLPVTVIKPTFDEDAARASLTALPLPDQALALARGKAESVNRIHSGWLVIGADQICEYDGKILGKPGSEENATAQLKTLQGRSHHQHTACVLMHQGKVVWQEVETATLTMRSLSDDDIAAYIRLDQPIHCCGAYKYEQHGKHLFRDIKGRDDVIQGFPVLKLLTALYDLGHLKMNALVG